MATQAWELADARVLLGDPAHNAGRSIDLDDNSLKPLLDLVGDDKLAGVITVSMWAEVINPSGASFDLRIRAQVQWGVAGASHTAMIDVRRGTLFSVPASSLRIAAANQGSTTAVRVGALAGYAPRGGPSHVTRTLYDDDGVAANGTEDFSVPDFAYDVDVRRNPASAPYTLRFLGGAAGGNLVYEVAVGANSDPGPIRLSNDIWTVRIANGATAITTSRAVFGLAL